MARKITKRQQQIYDFIKEYQQEKGYPPSVREMASAVGLSSPVLYMRISPRSKREACSSVTQPSLAPLNSLTKTDLPSPSQSLMSPRRPAALYHCLS